MNPTILCPSNQHQNAGQGGYNEQTWAVDVNARVQDLLKRAGFAATTVFKAGAGDRSTDELRWMVNEVNRIAKPDDRVLSIHSNASAGYDLGILVLCYAETRKAWAAAFGQKVAELLHLPWRGIQVRSDLMMLNGTTPPALILEVNAHDTAAGARYNLDNKSAIASAIARGWVWSLGGAWPEAPKPPAPTPAPADDDWTPEARKLVELGLMKARPDGSFGRYSPATRSEVAYAVHQALKLLGKL